MTRATHTGYIKCIIMLNLLGQEISDSALNGPLISYSITFRLSDSTGRHQEVLIPQSSRSTNLTSLLPWRFYDVTVTGVNSAGRGPASHPTRVSTLPASK